tara:strand:+ start:692 stop:925 length:234 start_codon:yes stop_codon:yes gene_type:complete
MSRTQEKLMAIVIGLVMLSLLGLVGSMDYEDEVAAELLYCTNVESWGISTMTDGSKEYGHPDFKGIAKDICPKYRPN